MRKKSYNETDIQVLSDVEHVKKRVSVYLGSNNPATYTIPLYNDTFSVTDVTFVPATYKAVGECLDNVVDEYTQHMPKKPLITILADPQIGYYQIQDAGRGVPIGKHETGKYTPEVVFDSLRSGRNFSDDRQAGVIGMNGMGVSLTRICSTEFNVTINREGKKYTQRFLSDKTFKPKIITGPKAKTGTQVEFTLDPSVFKDIKLPNVLLRNRAIEIAATNPGIQVQYNDEKFVFKKGFEDIVKSMSNQYFKFEADDMEFFVIFDVNKNIDEQIFTYVNSSLLFDGGICNTQFLNAFYAKAVDHLATAAKKQKCEVTKNDVRQNLLVIGNMKIANPEYDAQSKTRLTGPNLRKEFKDYIDNQWSSFARKNKKWLEDVLERACDRHHITANKQAVKEMAKQSRKKILGLNDATSKNRFDCQLLITEGKSAAASITSVRNPATTASFPLTGKVNNVYGMTVAQLLKAGKITDLLTSIGLVPGQKALRGNLRYGKIVIATDADYDGNDIFTLLVNIFFQFWPELFDQDYEPIVHRLIAPNVVAVKGTKRIHFTSRNDYEKVKHKYKGYEISYYKGLGSMVQEDWKMILDGQTDTLIPIIDDGKLNTTLELLFGPDANKRKSWLQDEE